MSKEENSNVVIGTSDMPAPQILAYDTKYAVKPAFKNDLEVVLAETAYADAKVLFNILERYEYVLPAAFLNEFIRRLASLPYKTVMPLMRVIEDKERINNYFEIIPKKKEETKK